MSKLILIPCTLMVVMAAAVMLLVESRDNASAGAGSAMSMAIDADPTGNTATSIGNQDLCARINNNGTLDADEDTTADTVDVDITATNIPADYAMTGFAAEFTYDEGALTVQSADTNQLLGSMVGSSVFNGSDQVPDTNNNGRFLSSAVDTGNGPETGSGVLSRLTISADAGANPFQYLLNFYVNDDGNVQAVTIDTSGDAWIADNASNAWIAIDMECGATPPPPPTPTPAPAFAKGDIQCDKDIDPVDALMIQRNVASLSTTQQPGCPAIGGNARVVSAGSAIFGDINCNNGIDVVDALFILRHVAGLNVSLPTGCDPIGP